MNRNHPKVRLSNQMGMAVIEWFTRGRCLLFQSRISSFDRTVLSDFLINHLIIPVPTLLPCIFLSECHRQLVFFQESTEKALFSRIHLTK